MSGTSVQNAIGVQTARRRGVLALGLSRIGFELRMYVRSGETIFFGFLFPILMLGLFSIVFGGDGPTSMGPGLPEITAAQLYLPGMLAAGLLLSGVQNLAIDIAMERSDGTLKRLGGTPLSPVGYFIGKLGYVLITGAAQAALLLTFAAVVFGVPLPNTAEGWLTFGWVFLLGITASALLGIALSALPRTGKSATAVVIPIMLVLQFISGVYLFFSLLPDWLQTVAKLFPVAWMAQGMRAVFLPTEYSALEPSGEWDLGQVAIALAIWLVVGLIISRLTFRWVRRGA